MLPSISLARTILKQHTQLVQSIRTMSTSTSIPQTMRGILIEKTGGSEVLQYRTDLPVPQPKEGELLVKNEFAGINYIDTYFRTGLYPSPKPEILGREGSGTVVSISSAPHHYSLNVGSRVVWMNTGGYAEYTAVPAKAAVPIPDGLSSELAVAAYLQGLTALSLIREAYHVQKGDWILVHAAAGGVGLWLVQLLHAVGANVIGTASTEDKLASARKAGATHTFLSTLPDDELIAKIKELSRQPANEVEEGEKPEEGVHAVFDGVGKVTFELDLAVVRRKGTIVSFGNASGAVDPVPLTKLVPKNVKLVRPTLNNYTATRRELETYTNELFSLVKDGKVDVKIHEIYDLKDVKRAHDDLEGRKTQGKLLLRI